MFEYSNYRIYLCIMCTFFPLKKLWKLRCVLYTESFVLDSRPSLAYVNKYAKFGQTQSFAFNWKVRDRTNEEIMILIHLKQLPFLFRRTTDEQSIKMATKFEEKRTRIWSSVSATWWPGGDAAARLFMTPFKITWLKNVKVVFAKENSNLALIPRRLTSVL